MVRHWIDLTLEGELNLSGYSDRVINSDRPLNENHSLIYLYSPSSVSPRGIITFDKENPWVHYSTSEQSGLLDVSLHENGEFNFSFREWRLINNRTFFRNLFFLGPKQVKLSNLELSKLSPTVMSKGSGIDFKAHFNTAVDVHDSLFYRNKVSEYPFSKILLSSLNEAINFAIDDYFE